MYKIVVLFTLLCLFPLNVFSANGIQFDGETYTKQFSNDNTEIRLVEYIRNHETLDNWTKLLAVRNFTQLKDPKLAVNDFAKVLKQQNPAAQFQILRSKNGSEAVIDFLTWTNDSNFMEFNIHRYLKVKGYNGLISYQFAYRLTDTSPQAMQAFKKNRQHWLAEMLKAKFDINFN